MPPTPTARLRVVAATPISEDLIARVIELEPRIDFIRDQTLLPPMRHPGDHSGDPAFTRTPEQQEAFEKLVDSAEVLYGLPDDKPSELARTVAANPGLRWVQTMPAGGGAQVKAANLDDDALNRIAFSTTAGVHAVPLAEWSVFGLLAGAKTLPKLLDRQRNKVWENRWTMGLISEQRILIVGLGSIGKETAKKLTALGATVIGTSRHETSLDNVAEIIHPDRMLQHLADIDGIVVTLPGTAETENLLGPDFFAAVKPGTTLVNVGRGTVIDETALLDALNDGRIGFAALDVVAQEPLDEGSPLWTHPHVLISPHTAALNQAEDRLIAELFARNATLWLEAEAKSAEANGTNADNPGATLINRVNTVEFY
ncbi:D-2-hydroxyacid dehydrogenase [Marisediminicola senii]|uniref:D-2-hydroxyacid dehydrogenase n=1 Tax=Marisediminicola senii TaxID=2711233 RepID=UPI001914B5B7|nr:D-2-hydroxyacid dehydrogenase [Marisediminicola senii]